MHVINVVGIMYERHAVKDYMRTMRFRGHNDLTFTSSGLLLQPDMSFLRASNRPIDKKAFRAAAGDMSLPVQR